MIVHTVVALAPIAAVAYILHALQVRIAGFDSDTWWFLARFSLIVLLLLLIPAILSGVFERGHMYVKWHPSHKIKLMLSIALFCAVGIETLLIMRSGAQTSLVSITGLLILIGSNLLVFLLSSYGLKITLGSHSLEKTSYQPDLFKEEPVDILVIAGQHAKEEAKILDPTKEN